MRRLYRDSVATTVCPWALWEISTWDLFQLTLNAANTCQCELGVHLQQPQEVQNIFRGPTKHKNMAYNTYL